MKLRRDVLIRICKVLIIVFSVAWAALSVLMLHQKLSDAVGIASFIALVLFSLLDYLVDRDVLLALYRGMKPVVFFLILATMGLAMYSLIDLGGVSELHAQEETKNIVNNQLLKIKSGFFALLVACLIAGGYAYWKFKATRFAEGRVGLLKDLLVQVNQILSDEKLDAYTKESKAINYCLVTLLAAIELSPWQWLMRKLKVIKRSFCVCAVEILEPDSANQNYRITAAVYPNDVPASAKSALEWIEKNYFPAYLDEAQFNDLVELAKGTNPKGWRSRFFNFKGREKVVSAVGWIGKKKITLLSHDASRCRAFDSSYMELLAGQNFVKQDLNWAKIRSFIGCPIGPPHLDPSPVLFVTKNIPHGFVDEDREVLIAVSQILNIVLSSVAAAKLVGPSGLAVAGDSV